MVKSVSSSIVLMNFAISYFFTFPVSKGGNELNSAYSDSRVRNECEIKKAATVL